MSIEATDFNKPTFTTLASLSADHAYLYLNKCINDCIKDNLPLDDVICSTFWEHFDDWSTDLYHLLDTYDLVYIDTIGYCKLNYDLIKLNYLKKYNERLLVENSPSVSYSDQMMGIITNYLGDNVDPYISANIGEVTI